MFWFSSNNGHGKCKDDTLHDSVTKGSIDCELKVSKNLSIIIWVEFKIKIILFIFINRTKNISVDYCFFQREDSDDRKTVLQQEEKCFLHFRLFGVRQRNTSGALTRQSWRDPMSKFIWVERYSLYPASGENTRRGTLGFTVLISQEMWKTRSGVNLDDDEWGMLSYNFGSIKEAFASRKDAFEKHFHQTERRSEHCKNVQSWVVLER